MAVVTRIADAPQLLTVHEVARALRCSDETIRRRVADGTLKSIRLAGITRIPESELARVLNPDTRS